MNSVYHYEYSSMLERVLAVAYETNYSLPALEKSISYSSFFQSIEDDINVPGPIITDEELIKDIFPELNINLKEIKEYAQTHWVSESYMWIQEQTGLTFEAIFLKLPIKEMYDLFPIYHEMDFSEILDEFLNRHIRESTFSILLERCGYNLSELSNLTHISYETLYSLKKRRREIKKTSVEIIATLAKVFKVRIETLAEIRQTTPIDMNKLLADYFKGKEK